MSFTWLAPIIVFGIVIFVHELGHFLAAKRFGVYAPRFSVGFGPALWRRRRGETEYIVAAVPLGGYVRMASKDDESTAFLEGGGEEALAREQEGATKPKDWDPEAMIPHGPKSIPPDRWFESKPLWQRVIILIAGVTMNVLLAWVVTVGTVAAYGEPYLPAVVDSVVVGRPAASAGMLSGDSVIAIDGRPISTFTEMVDIISARPEQATTIEVVRGGTRRTITVTPVAEDFTDPIAGGTSTVGRIGVVPRGIVARRGVGPVDALVTGTRATVAMAGSIVGVVRGLFTGNVGVGSLGGPIAIARVSVEAAQGGLEIFLSLIAFLSINIAVLNLLPIPVLDGGQILIHVLEAIKGSPFSPRAREYILRAGLALILMLVVIVMYNDIRALTLSLLGRS